MADKKPTTIKIDIKTLVNLLDPKRDDPTVEYDFPGRKFKRKPGGWYDDI